MEHVEKDLELHSFRALIHRLDPTQPAAEPSWYVERPDGVGTALARSLMLDPAGTHLVVGSIGSGKSSELWAAERALQRGPDLWPRTVDVGAAIELEREEVALIVVAMGDLLAHLQTRFPQHSEDLDHFESRHRYLSGQDGWGKANIEPDPRKHLALLHEVAQLITIATGGHRLVWLLDGLDRTRSTEAFDALVEPFLEQVKQAGVGVVVVGPPRVLVGTHRLGAAERFDDLHWLGPVDPTPGGPGHSFLRRLLEARGVTEWLSESVVDALIRWSGGVPRSLLHLAREAFKETWVRNVGQPGLPQVQAAADKLGRSLLMGLTDDEVDLLEGLLKRWSFAPRFDHERALVPTNRVLEYRRPDGSLRHVVHPCLAPFIHTLRPQAEEIPF
jgi:hypothetical protein